MITQLSEHPIVAPIDFTEEADRGVLFALSLAKSPEFVTALHVAPPLAAFEPGVVWDMVSDQDRLGRLREVFNERYHDERYKGMQFAVRFGEPAHEISDFAQELKAGLIVMPSHGRTGFSHIVMGSVAERVVRFAHCPVLVLKS
ncbi:MAG: universal stress protein [Pirellulales bacterium]|nr:universal stress protein [Pirellulales bacterium]MBX3433216.1 universal stress protein [Pirellulales bacterium]